MAKRCRTCGQLLPQEKANWLPYNHALGWLRDGEEVYRAGDGSGRWFLTHGRGEVSPEDVRHMAARGIIQPVYNTCPNEAYHMGPTLDIEATLEARKRYGKSAPFVYVTQP